MSETGIAEAPAHIPAITETTRSHPDPHQCTGKVQERHDQYPYPDGLTPTSNPRRGHREMIRRAGGNRYVADRSAERDADVSRPATSQHRARIPGKSITRTAGRTRIW